MVIEPASLPDSRSSNETSESLRAIFELTLLADGAKPLGRFLQEAVDLAATALPADQVILVTFDLKKNIVSGFAQSRSIGDPVVSPSFTDVMDLLAAEGYLFSSNAKSVPASSPSYGRTSISALLSSRERIFGLLRASNRSNPFQEQDRHYLSTFAGILVTAIEKIRLEVSNQQQNQQLETLRDLTRILNYRLDQRSVLEMILDQLARVIEYDSASVMLIINQRPVIVAHRLLRSPVQAELPLNIDDYAHIREVIEQCHPVIIGDTRLDHRWRPAENTEYIRCWLGVPLRGRDHVIGLLNLDKEDPYYYSQDHANLALTFANQSAIAIENANLYETVRQRADQLDALRATIVDISSELELPRLLHAILERAVTLLKATGGDLGLFDEEQQTIRIVTSHKLGRDYTGTQMQIGEGAMGLAFKESRAIVIDDYSAWPNASPQYRHGHWHAVLAAPFLIGQRVVGAIGVVDADPKRRFSPADESLLSLFAQHAAIAVENARLYRDARESADRRAILHQVSQKIVAANLNQEDIYTEIHAAAGLLMPAEAFVICQYDEGSRTVEGVYLVDKGGRTPPIRDSIDRGLSGKVIRSGESIYIADLLETKLEDAIHFGDEEEVRSVLAAPMRLRGKVVGMVSTQSYQPHAYNSEDIVLLEMLATYAAIALENASLFQRIQQMAITDPGTGIYNRRYLFEMGEREFVRCQRFQRTLAVIMIDIDYFKHFNDRLGHVAGDKVLHDLAQSLKSNIREIDIVGRYGGEEFLIILPETALQGGYEIAERLRRMVQVSFVNEQDPSCSITVSIGVSAFNGGAMDFISLVHQADMALYSVKSSGRNRVAVYKINMASPNE